MEEEAELRDLWNLNPQKKESKTSSLSDLHIQNEPVSLSNPKKEGDKANDPIHQIEDIMIEFDHLNKEQP